MATWRDVGPLLDARTNGSTAARGECPSFFPLPRSTPGAATPRRGGNASRGDGTERGLRVPWTHVHKTGCQNVPGMPPTWPGDCVAMGVYSGGEPGTPGVWSSSPAGYVPVDRGQSWGGFAAVYAGKPMWDGKNGRRLYFGNICAPPSRPQTLPREVTYHPALDQLVWSPLTEQAQLRGRVLASVQRQDISVGSPVHMQGSAQSEIVASFSLLPGPQNRRVPAWASATRRHQAGAGDFVFGVGLLLSTAGVAAELQAHVRIRTATIVDDDGGNTSGGDGGVRSAASATVGVSDPSTGFAATASLPLLPQEQSVEIRCFVDRTLLECFFQGRVPLTMPLAPLQDQIARRARIKNKTCCIAGDVHLLCTALLDVLSGLSSTTRPSKLV